MSSSAKTPSSKRRTPSAPSAPSETAAVLAATETLRTEMVGSWSAEVFETAGADRLKRVARQLLVRFVFRYVLHC